MINTAQGRSIEEYRSQDDAKTRQHEYRRFMLPFLVLMGSQLPLTLVYLTGLWSERPHYGLMPFAIVGSVLFILWRWPRKDEPVFFSSPMSNMLLIAGVVLGLLGTLFLSPWFAFAAFLCLIGSLLAMTNNRHVFGTLLSALTPMVVLLQPPVAIDFDTVQGDIQLMSVANSSATRIASDVLDLASYPHNISDSRMEFPFGILDSTDLGNNTFSMFTLLIITGLFIAWQRIPVFRGMMLLFAACFWSMTFEAIELIICAIARTTFEKDLFSPGIANRILQITSLFVAGVFTLMSERLIAFLFGPVDLQAIDENISYQDKICRFWNMAIAGISSPVIDVNVKKEIAWAKRRNSVPPKSTSTLLWGCGVLLGVLSLLQVTGLANAWSRSGDSIFTSDTPFTLSKNSIAETIAGCSRFEYESTEPAESSALNTVEHHWVFVDASEQEYHVVISQPRSGWHNIDREFRSFDWDRVMEFEPVESQSDADQDAEPEPIPVSELKELQFGDQSVQFFTAYYRNNLAEYRSVFSFQVDGFGSGFMAPETWSNPAAFVDRAIARVADRTRPRVLSGLSLQVTVYSDTIGPNPETTRVQVARLFEGVVQQTLSSIEKGSFGASPAQNE